jgi:adenine phosphoribosyltransferase
MLTIDLKQMIRSVPDFPKPGINFFDITTLLKEPAGLKATIDALAAPYADSRIDAVVGIESRGFILGSAVAQQLGRRLCPRAQTGEAARQSHQRGV